MSLPRRADYLGRLLQRVIVLSLTFICGFGSLVAASPMCGTTGFAPPKLYNITGLGGSIGTGDFNNDGHPDFAASVGNQGISVFLNDGTGNFASQVFSPTGAGHPDLAIGDFNNDGNLDIATVYVTSINPRVLVLLGNGDGSLNDPIYSPSGGLTPYFIAAGDFNGDGKLDVAVSNSGDGGETGRTLTILVGNGSGSFTLASTNAPTGFMRTGDFNRDGKMDVMALANPSLSLRLGDGMGNLAAPVPVNGSSTPQFVVADLNHDGAPDIGAGFFSLLVATLNNGNGTFSPPTGYYAGLEVYSWIAAGDVNGDGHMDLVGGLDDTNPGHPGVLSVLPGTGTGAFRPAIRYLLYNAQPQYIAVADFNGDGRADVAAVHADALKISVHLSICLAPGARYDFDGDGKSDICVYRPSSGTWYALRSSDNSLLSQNWGTGSDQIVPGDYDGDSKADVAVYRPSSGTWYVLKSSDSTFTAQPFGTSTDKPVAADYDADGRTDIAVYRAGVWYILRSSDDAFVSYTFGNSTDRPMPADYDGDGMTELAVYRPSTGVWYIRSNLDGPLKAQAFGASGDVPLTGDFDGDGKFDLAVFRPSTGTWYALRSGNNSLMAQPWGVSTDVPAAADYDGDGKTDVAVFRPSDGAWYVLRSANNSLLSQQFGLSEDVPVPAGY